jgi:hypothetical protein
MRQKKVKRTKKNPLSKDPYKRRTAPEMLRILNEIEQGIHSIWSACFKYGLNRNTLKLWKSKLAMRNLGLNQSADFLESMNENQKLKALNIKVRELSRALEKSELKVFALETVIKVAEDDFKIRIKKKHGTKRSKE